MFPLIFGWFSHLVLSLSHGAFFSVLIRGILFPWHQFFGPGLAGCNCYDWHIILKEGDIFITFERGWFLFAVSGNLWRWRPLFQPMLAGECFQIANAHKYSFILLTFWILILRSRANGGVFLSTKRSFVRWCCLPPFFAMQMCRQALSCLRWVSRGGVWRVCGDHSVVYVSRAIIKIIFK